MGYAFFSYSSKDWEMTDSFRTLFNKNGIKTWMAPRDVQVGVSYIKEINCAIKKLRMFCSFAFKCRTRITMGK